MEKAIFYIFLAGNLDKELVFNAIHRLSHTLLPPTFLPALAICRLTSWTRICFGSKTGLFHLQASPAPPPTKTVSTLEKTVGTLEKTVSTFVFSVLTSVPATFFLPISAATTRKDSKA